jgi:hypothetical protein
MKDCMSIYRAHIFTQQACEAYLLAHHLTGYNKEYQLKQARERLGDLAEELGLTITWPEDRESEAAAAAVATSRQLEAEDAARDDTFAELVEMTEAPKEAAHA